MYPKPFFKYYIYYIIVLMVPESYTIVMGEMGVSPLLWPCQLSYYIISMQMFYMNLLFTMFLISVLSFR